MRLNLSEPKRLNGHNFLCLCLYRFINLLDHLVCNLLDLLLAFSLIIFRNFSCLLHLLDRIIGITADIADSYFNAFSLFFDILRQFFSPLFRQFREDKADGMAVVIRIDAQIRGEDSSVSKSDRKSVV